MEPKEGVDHGGLPSPVRSQQSDGPAGNLGIHPAQGFETAESDTEILKLDNWFHGFMTPEAGERPGLNPTSHRSSF